MRTKALAGAWIALMHDVPLVFCMVTACLHALGPAAACVPSLPAVQTAPCTPSDLISE